jgi:hypothetical protein
MSSPSFLAERVYWLIVGLDVPRDMSKYTGNH